MGGRRTHEGEDVGGDDEDDEEREEVDEPGAERGHGGGHMARSSYTTYTLPVVLY